MAAYMKELNFAEIEPEIQGDSLISERSKGISTGRRFQMRYKSNTSLGVDPEKENLNSNRS